MTRSSLTGRWDLAPGRHAVPQCDDWLVYRISGTVATDPDGGTPLERWVAETDAVGGGKTQCQLTGANDIGGTFRALIDSNYFNGEAWSNGSPITGTGDRPLSLYSNDRTDTEWDQLIYHSGLSWVINAHPNLSTPAERHDIGHVHKRTRRQRLGACAQHRAAGRGHHLSIAAGSNGSTTAKRRTRPGGLVLVNDGSSTQRGSGKGDIESAERIVPEISRITRIRGFGSSGVVLADGRTKDRGAAGIHRRNRNGCRLDTEHYLCARLGNGTLQA